MIVTAPVSLTPSPEVLAALRPRGGKFRLPSCPRCGCRVREPGLWVVLGEDCCSVECARKWGRCE